MSWVAAAAGAVSLGVGLAKEGSAKKTANELANSRPQYQISPLTGQDLSFAQSELANNSSAGEKAYNTLNNGQFSSSIGATLRAGGTPNDIGAIYGNNQDGRLKLAMMSDNLRLARINNYVNASQAMQNAQQTQWQVNKYGPYQDAVQANAAARQGASQMVSQGFNTLASGVANGVQQANEKNNFSLPDNYNSGSPVYQNPIIPINTYKNNSFSSANTLTPMNYPTYNQQ